MPGAQWPGGNMAGSMGAVRIQPQQQQQPQRMVTFMPVSVSNSSRKCSSAVVFNCSFAKS